MSAGLRRVPSRRRVARLFITVPRRYFGRYELFGMRGTLQVAGREYARREWLLHKARALHGFRLLSLEFFTSLRLRAIFT